MEKETTTTTITVDRGTWEAFKACSQHTGIRLMPALESAMTAFVQKYRNEESELAARNSGPEAE